MERDNGAPDGHIGARFRLSSTLHIGTRGLLASSVYGVALAFNEKCLSACLPVGQTTAPTAKYIDRCKYFETPFASSDINQSPPLPTSPLPRTDPHSLGTMFTSTLRLTIFMALFCLMLGVTATPVLRVPPAKERALVRQERNLSNAQRLARGLPINKPKRHYDGKSIAPV